MSSNPAERRRSPRLHLQLPIFVRGVDASGDDFLDLSRTIDISSVGACLAISRSMKLSEVVSLTIPAPPPTSAGLVPAETRPIQGRVRRSSPAGDVHLIGVEFTRPLE
ncbi:MAG: PilZ domain-containing protein [Acidobacteria bacterium]|nr:PilZ domain-containing protein [Acidobacteriota bacterium]MBI3661913.1 PilZ domain-containing protein [Acidobacteriota bacterium]